jgi:outer membrane lipoprotein SlyB
LAGETEVRQKPDVWKKIVIIGGAGLGGFAGWYYGGTDQNGVDIVLGLMIGAFVGNWLWGFSN